ncbi:MAG: MarR family transcriptional regulator, partial [Acidimicrobiales bacterium]
VSSETESPRESEQLAWSLMQQFVDNHSRWNELAAILGCRPGGGRARVLFRLHNGPMTLGDLARAEHFDAPYATVIVNKLEGLGLVARTAHPDDNRRKLVTLTPKGQRAIATADEILETPPDALKQLSESELKKLSSFLRRLSGSHQL